MKIKKVELYAVNESLEPYDIASSFIEAVDSGAEKVIFVLEDGTRITFYDACFSNGSNTVDIQNK